ncbi:ThiF family adenylyltransferase [Flagellimonas aequoris]|uniref:ThiF family adenylyltransferase n=1 Tax=Flagellimonas aequoris TaxID=2306997 RepID=A0A418N469_9FLAO|nr:ThiF family adenylyltransferase [Allomuricauda aequoris]RIV68687.1 ThiF family adenylyltransferase [Allomuricauda aequoris]TXK00386.1 ThiF family adenylyltransferase [Allomuricauda aequoris]
MKYTLTLSERHYEELRSLIIQKDGLERPAIVLCGRSSVENDLWDGGEEERFLSYRVVPIPENEIIGHSKTHVFWDTKTFRKAMKICKEENLAICVVHNHPNNCLEYSEIDNDNEPSLFKGIFNRNGEGRPHASLVITPDGNIFGRVWTYNLKSEKLSLIRVLGEKFQFHYPDKKVIATKDIFHRQELAFGSGLSKDLSKLTIGVIGCGATGSSTAHLLSRLGVGKLLLVDDDIVERTNLSRLYGASAADADAGRAKVEMLKSFITDAGIGTRVRAIKNWVGSQECRTAIKSCDIIFGCTDDHSGRMFLNRFAHFYLTPVFDMGIMIDPDESDLVGFKSIQGRMNVVQCGNVCLLCRMTVDPTLAREEDLKRSDPKGYFKEKDQGYIKGIDIPNPAVITFTSEISNVSVNEFLNRIIGFKKEGAQSTLTRFFDKGMDRKPGGKKREGCPICDSENYWGRGDIKPFMDNVN